MKSNKDNIFKAMLLTLTIFLLWAGTVVAQKTGCISGFSPSTLSFSSSGGSKTTSLTVLAFDCNWSLSSKPTWASVSPSSGTMNKTITVTCSANTGLARSGTVSFTDGVGSRSFTVQQSAGGTTPPDPPDPKPCTVPAVTPSGPITGSTSVCSYTTQAYSISPRQAPGTDSYIWSVPPGSSIVLGQGTTSIRVSIGVTSGSVSVKAVNGCGSSGSISTDIYVTVPPSVAGQSGSVTKCQGETATFTVIAKGSDLSYKWEYMNPKATTFSPCGEASSTSATLFTTGGISGTQYRCRVYNSCSTVYSNAVTLTRRVPPSVTTQPANVVVCPGNPFAFSVTATGDDLTYQWEEYSGGIWVSSTLSGSTTCCTSKPTATTGDNGRIYRCRVVSTYCGTVYSSTATVTIKPAPVVTVSPANPSILPGNQITLEATGAVTYTWSPATSLSSDKGSVVTANPLSTTTYKVIGTADNGCSTSVSRIVKVFEVHLDLNDCQGGPPHGSPAPLEGPPHPPFGTCITANASNGTGPDPSGGPYTYLWSTGETSSTTYILYNGIYIVKVTDDNGNTVMGSIQITTLNDPPSMERQYSRLKVQDVLKENVLTVQGIASLASSEKAEGIIYKDALGRSIQSIALGATPNQKDVVQLYEYDVMGRQVKSYLPYPDNTSSESLRGSASFNQSLYYFTSYSCDLHPYSEAVYDSSPMNMVLERSAPGDAWRVNKTAGVSNRTGHTQKVGYRSNTPADHVYLWRMDGDSTYIAGEYPANELRVAKMTDEDGRETETYTNKYGQTVLQFSPGMVKTYTVYDDFGLPRFVLPPEAFDSVAKLYALGQNPSMELLRKMAYVYTYDHLHRLVEKKIPSKEEIYYIYNTLDQVVLAQDGELRKSNQWAFIKYDMFQRTAMSGVYTHAAPVSRQDMQNLVYGHTVLFENRVAGQEGVHGYTNQAFPTAIASGDVYNVAYYDDYSFDVLPARGYSNVRAFCESIDNADFAKGEIFYRVKGKVTGTKTKVLNGSGTMMLSVVLYDDRGRAIRTYEENHLGGCNLSLAGYSFAGQLLKARQVHYKDAGSTAQNIYYRFGYDHAGRMLDSYFQLDGNPEVRMATYQYDEMGKLVNKQVHAEAGSSYQTFLQSFSFTYNIRGWLTSMNDPGSAGQADKLFGVKLYYNATPDAETTPGYSGNIAAAQWRTKGREGIFQYSYTYDAQDRLVEADFKENLTNGWTNPDKYDMAIGYDRNGNITNLKRYGKLNTLVDDLYYKYADYTTLKKVEDLAVDALAGGFTEKASLPEEYTYNANGAMVADANKGLSVAYNLLNLPERVTMEDGKSVEYLYSASGRKLARYVYSGSTLVSAKNYTGCFVYNEAGLEFIGTAEGRVVPSGSSLQYEYFIADQQGNVRVSYTKGSDGKAAIVQENHYDPFGGKLPGMSYLAGMENKYLYSGKELQDEVGMDWYDFGWRMYDPQLGRWHAADPLAELAYSRSPYQFCSNNPVNRVDPDGLTDNATDLSQDETMMISGSSVAAILQIILGNWNNLGSNVDAKFTFTDGKLETITTTSLVNPSEGKGNAFTQTKTFLVDGSGTRATEITSDVMLDEVFCIGESKQKPLGMAPSLTNRKEQELFESPLISAKVFSSKTKEGTDPSREVTFVDQKISSFTFNTNGGISYSFGVDGSFSTSMGFLSTGTDLQGNYSIEVSVSTGFNTNSGLELSINKYVGNGLIVVGATVITFGILPAGGGLVLAFP